MMNKAPAHMSSHMIPPHCLLMMMTATRTKRTVHSFTLAIVCVTESGLGHSTTTPYTAAITMCSINVKSLILSHMHIKNCGLKVHLTILKWRTQKAHAQTLMLVRYFP